MNSARSRHTALFVDLVPAVELGILSFTLVEGRFSLLINPHEPAME